MLHTYGIMPLSKTNSSPSFGLRVKKRVLLFFATLPQYHKASVLYCDKTLRTFENTLEMQKTLACGSRFKYPSCFITL